MAHRPPLASPRRWPAWLRSPWGHGHGDPGMVFPSANRRLWAVARGKRSRWLSTVVGAACLGSNFSTAVFPSGMREGLTSQRKRLGPFVAYRTGFPTQGMPARRRTIPWVRAVSARGNSLFSRPRSPWRKLLGRLRCDTKGYSGSPFPAGPLAGFGAWVAYGRFVWRLFPPAHSLRRCNAP
jgi:hypothetical protein